MGAVYHDSPETLLALMLALPAQVVVGHTPPVIEEEGKLQLPFLAHSRHSKQSSFPAENKNHRKDTLSLVCVISRGENQGKFPF